MTVRYFAHPNGFALDIVLVVLTDKGGISWNKDGPINHPDGLAVTPENCEHFARQGIWNELDFYQACSRLSDEGRAMLPAPNGHSLKDVPATCEETW